MSGLQRTANFDWNRLAGTVNAIDWGIQTAATAYNALRQVPPAKWAAILNYTSTDDHSAYVQAAVNSFGGAGSVARGVVLLPGGRWNLNTAAIVLPFEVSVRGSGGRSTHLFVNGDFDAFSWDQAAPSFSRQVSITDMWVTGPGYGKVGATVVTMAQAGTASANGTNMAAIATAFPGVVPLTVSSGININHPWGIDSLTLKRLWIEEFPTVGIRANQPASGATKNCFQFSDWDSLYLRYCNVGISLGFGFTGESSFSNVCSQFMLTSCLDFTINSFLTGPQGINFVNLVTGWSPYGVRMTNGTAGNIKFDMFHAEHHTTAAVYLNSPSINQVVFETSWMAANVAGILGDAGGNIAVNNGVWQGAGNTSDAFIKLNAASNFNIALTGMHTIVAPASGSAPTSHVVTPDINTIRGVISRTSATTGSIAPGMTMNTVLQSRGLMGESATVVPKNLTGSATIGNGTTSVAVAFVRAETDALYKVAASVDWGVSTPPAWAHNLQVGNKTVNGFSVTFGTAAPVGGCTLNWILTR